MSDGKPTFKSVADQLDRCATAYAEDVPDYLRVRMLSLVRQARASLDEAEVMLNELDPDGPPATGELSQEEFGDIFAGKLSGTLKAISLIGGVIGILERKWARPHSEFETAVIQSLSEAQEAVRIVHVSRAPYPTIMDCIEAGLAGNEQRCREYANLLLTKLQETHQARPAERLGRILRGEKGQMIGLAEESEV